MYVIQARDAQLWETRDAAWYTPGKNQSKQTISGKYQVHMYQNVLLLSPKTDHKKYWKKRPICLLDSNYPAHQVFSCYHFIFVLILRTRTNILSILTFSPSNFEKLIS